MLNKVIYKFKNSRYHVKQVDENKLIIVDGKEKYNLEVINNKIFVNKSLITPKQLIDYFFNNVRRNQYIFFSFLVITAFLFIFAVQAKEISESFILLRPFIHYNPINFIINSIAVYVVYSAVHKLSPRLNLITMIFGMAFSTLFIVLKGDDVFGSSGILCAFLPFVLIRERTNMYMNIVLIAIAASILSYIFPFISAPSNLGGYLGGVIVFVYAVRNNKNFSRLYFSRVNK